MSSRTALRTCMQVLVLLDLVFVQLTEAAGLHWLAPLYVLTLAAPLLQRFRERRFYQALWNGGVVCFFLVLVRHAMRAELAYVLEDGLVLAALCQVHLLNNLRSNQRPDLLFFNAFLIAIIAGYICRGLGFPIAFLLFAPAFVMGLELLTAGAGERDLPAGATRHLLFDSSRRALLLMGASLLVFLFWPRDFERKAFFHGRLEMADLDPDQLEIGFNDRLNLDRRGNVDANDKEALRVILLEGRRSAVPPLWRGATLSVTDGNTWRVGAPGTRRDAGPTDDPWHQAGSGLARGGADLAGATRVEVLRFTEGTERLFLPLEAAQLQLATEHANVRLRARGDATLESAQSSELRYAVALPARRMAQPAPEGSPPATPSASSNASSNASWGASGGDWQVHGEPADPRGGRFEGELPAFLAAFVELPETRQLFRSHELAERLAARLPAEVQQHELVARFSDHLSRSYTYFAPGAEGAATTLNEFLRGEGGGHCEFFASALATMLRSRGVPCRVATGFRSTSWDERGRVLRFGTRDAHAWVEVYDPEGGWYAVDPSPASAMIEAGDGLWARLRAEARALWTEVTQFNAESRAAAFAWFRALPGRLLEAFRESPLAAALLALLAGALALLVVRRRRARTPAAVRAYRRALQRTRLRLLPGETPRELLVRARGCGLEAGRVEALEQATRTHEAARYAA